MDVKKFKNNVSSKSIECRRYSASAMKWKIRNKQAYERKICNKY